MNKLREVIDRADWPRVLVALILAPLTATWFAVALLCDMTTWLGDKFDDLYEAIFDLLGI